MGTAAKIIILVFAVLAASCSRSAPVGADTGAAENVAAEQEQGGYAVLALVASIPGDVDASRMRTIRTIEVDPAGRTAHVEGDYYIASKTGQPDPLQRGKFVIEAKKTDGKWAIVSDDLSDGASAAPPR